MISISLKPSLMYCHAWMLYHKMHNVSISEVRESSRDLDVGGGKLVEYRCCGIPGVYIQGRNPKVRQWFAVKPSPYFF